MEYKLWNKPFIVAEHKTAPHSNISKLLTWFQILLPTSTLFSFYPPFSSTYTFPNPLFPMLHVLHWSGKWKSPLQYMPRDKHFAHLRLARQTCLFREALEAALRTPWTCRTQEPSSYWHFLHFYFPVLSMWPASDRDSYNWQKHGNVILRVFLCPFTVISPEQIEKKRKIQ